MITTPFSSAGDMKYHLQSLLDSKEKQLQQAGTLGQRVLAQQMELEERIRQLQEIDADKLDDEHVDDDARDRYRELAETLMAWDKENADLSSAFGSRVGGKPNFWDISLYISLVETRLAPSTCFCPGGVRATKCQTASGHHRCCPVPPRKERRPSRR
jgi:hypothetical protein